MMLDGKKGVHLDGSSGGRVARLEVLEGPSGRRVRSEVRIPTIATTRYDASRPPATIDRDR